MSARADLDSLPGFLAHARALEEEACARYLELADAMAVHHNDEVAALFRELASLSRQHAQEILAMASQHTLPAIEPWAFAWGGDEGPETGSPQDLHYLMTPAQALELALGNEQRGQAFYARVGRESASPQVRELAQEFAEEEAGHVAALERWLARAAETPAGWADDPDPPQMPD